MQESPVVPELESCAGAARSTELRRAKYRRSLKVFAAAVVLTMLLIVADPYVVEAALAGRATSPPSDVLSGNETQPALPPPPPPVEQPQRPVEPGTITQGWDDASIVSMPKNHQPVLTQNDSHVSYLTSYGTFVLSKREPYFVSVYDVTTAKVADSAFLVLKGGTPWGTLLIPTNGKIDLISLDFLKFKYDLRSGKELQGRLTVTYQFLLDHDKITASFVPSVGRPADFQIVWLTFTAWDIIDVTTMPADVEQRFEDLRGYGAVFQLAPNFEILSAVGMWSTIVKPAKSIGAEKSLAGLYLNVDDAMNDSAGTFAGRFTFGSLTGNVVLAMFATGRLTIDPQLVISPVSSEATAFSGVQRKTFFDGKRYWLFWKESANTVVSYASSLDGKNWGSFPRTAVTANPFGYGFTVINSGSTVGVIWSDNSDSTAIHIRTGLITEDVIVWDDASPTGRQLYTGCGFGCSADIASPVSATFTSQGSEFGIAWKDSGGNKVGFLRFICTGAGSRFSPCASTTREVLNGGLDPEWYGGHPLGYASTLVVALDNDRLARIALDALGTDYPDDIKLFVDIFGGSGEMFCSNSFIDYFNDWPRTSVPTENWWRNGMFTAAASSGNTYLFVETFAGSILGYAIDGGCNFGRWSVGAWSSGTSSLTAGAASDGTVYLFYLAGSAAKYVTVSPNNWMGGIPSSVTAFSGYNSISYPSVASSASHFIPLAFTHGTQSGICSSTCLFYSSYPLPLDGEASTTNPWASKLGAPLVNDVGGVVSPTTGLLAVGQSLVQGSPSLSIIYREPGLFNLDGTKYPSGYDAYQIIPGIYYDLPWIVGATPASIVLQMTGGQKYILHQTGLSGSMRWFNITAGGMRYTVAYSSSTNMWTLTQPSGASMQFNQATPGSNKDLTKVYLDPTGQNFVTYATTFSPVGGTITDSSGRQITFSTSSVAYGNSQTITLTKLGLPTGCTGTLDLDSQTLQVTDVMGRTTKYSVCKWKLTKLESPNGGRVDYRYTSNPTDPPFSCNYPSGPVSQGTEAVSCPITQMDIYNESAANVKARSLVFNWNFQNGEVVRALVNTTDKSAIVQGSNEYIFNSAAGTASVRTYDSTGQVLYYDMDTLNGANMKDLSGNGNHGTISNMASLYGRIGKARDTGTTGFIQVPASSSLNVIRDITISIWFNPTSASDTYRALVEDYYPGSGYLLTLDANVGGKLRWFVGKDGTNSVDVVSDAVPATGVWSHAVVTAEAGGKLRMYLNGVQQADVKDIPSIYPRSYYDWFIGTWSGSFKGSIDELRIFNRALSPEDAVALYNKNAIKKGEQHNWYSINDTPHLSEGFVGDEPTASVVTQDAIDDWGNQIYSRNALGNETFASYANTNHQNHFYAPGRLTKSTNTQFSTEFIDFSDGTFPTGQGTWSLSAGSAQVDYTQFNEVTPALRIASSTTIAHTVIASGPTYVEFKLRLDSEVEFHMQLGTSSAYYAGIMIQSVNGWVGAFQNPNTWKMCNLPGGAQAIVLPSEWHRFTMSIDYDATPNYEWKAWMDGIDLTCVSTLTLSGQTPTTMKLETAGSGLAWVDDIKLYKNNCKVGSDTHCTHYSALDLAISGLQLRQSVSLVAENGTVIDQALQTGTSTVFISFNSALTGTRSNYENGHNAKSTIRIYAEDGTLEYQSPLTRFFVGEMYTYTRPKGFGDEIIKTRSGGLYWNTLYADDSCSGVACSPAPYNWNFVTAPTVRGALSQNYVAYDPFSYGERTHIFHLTSPASPPSYFTTHVRIPFGMAPDSMSILVQRSGVPYYWYQAYWGDYPTLVLSPPIDGKVYMGPIPATRDQWVELRVSAVDLGVGFNWDGFGISVEGGQVEWDAITTQTIGYLTVNQNLPSSVTIGVYYANNGTLIATGTESNGYATVPLYDKTRGITSFPVKANIKIYDANNEYYFGPVRDIWPGDIFDYTGPSGFFDSKSSGTVYWPSSTIHTAVLGSKTFSGDCLDAVACYDMETGTETSMALVTGVVTVKLLDLSGKNNDATRFGGSQTLSDAAGSAAGLGTKFVPITLPYVSATDSSSLKLGTANFTVSAWFYASVLPATGSYYEVVGKRVNNGGDYEIRLSNTGGITKVLATVGDSTGSVTVTSNATISANTLYHVTFRRLSGTLSLWLNGAIAASTATGNKNTDSTSNLEIGRDPWTIGNFFNGIIDQVLVYKQALSTVQIIARYQSRLPGAPQTYLRFNDKGLPITSRTPYEGTYLYVAATYDSKGNVLSVTDVGRTTTGGANVTRYAYSTVFGRDYRTQTNRSDGQQVYTAYDFQSGVKYGNLDIDCRRSRTQYDSIGRPTQTSIYNTDSSEVLHLDMETATYNSLKDVSCAGNQNSALGQTITSVGGTADSGPEGMSRNLGSGGSVTVADSSSLAFGTGSFTISFWAYLTALPTSGQGRLLIKTNYPTSWWTIDFNQNRTIEFESNIATKTSTGAGLTAGQWRHIAVVIDRTAGKVLFYFDGVLDSQPAASFSGSPDSAQPLKAPEAGGSGTLQFNGKLDEVRIFKTVLSASSISDLRNFRYKLLTSSSAAYDDMNAYPEFFGYAGTSVTSYDGVSIPRSLFLDMQTKKATVGSTDYLEDLSGNGNSGKVGSGVTLGAAGKVGSAATFPGTTAGYVSAPTRFVAPTKAFTVAFWVWPTSLPASDTFFFGATAGPGQDALYGKQNNRNFWCVLVNTAGVYYSPFNVVLTVNQWNHVACTFDGSKLQVYLNGAFGGGVTLFGTPRIAQADFKVGGYAGLTGMTGTIDEFQIIPQGLDASGVSNLFNSAETSHISKSYHDGIGRKTKTVTMDMFGNKLQTVATLGWNDQPIYSYLPSGQYSAFSYDFLGRTLTVQSPGDSTISGISKTVVSERAKMVEVIDAIGRKVYTKTDLLGRTIETGVWNLQTSTYGNRTSTLYNALSKVTARTDANLQTTTVYFNSLGLPKMSIFPDNSYSVVYYDDNLRAFQAVDVMGRISTSVYDSLGRVTSTSVKASGAGVLTLIDQYLNPVGGTSTYYNTWDSIVGSGDCSVSAHYGCVNDGATPDDGTTYASTATASETESHLMEDVSIPAGYTDIDVTWEGRCQKSSASVGGQISHLVRETDGTGEEDIGANNEFACPSGSWTTFTFFMEQSPGGGEWTPAEINALECGYKSSTVVNPAPQVTNLRCRVQVTYPGYITGYTYDVHDDLVGIDNVTSKITRTYDSLHQLISERLDTPANLPTFTGTVSYAYDTAGKITAIGTPSTGSGYSYDSFGRVRIVSVSPNKEAEIAYDSNGRMSNIYYWSTTGVFPRQLPFNTTLQEKYTYDARDRMTQIKVFDSSTIHMQLNYTYNRASEITAVTDNMLGTDKVISYQYDGNGRLTYASGPWGTSEATETHAYTYDKIGNLLTWKVGGTTFTYTIAGWNRLDSFSFNTMSFLYNTAGSMTCKTESSASTRYTQDFLQQLTKAEVGVPSACAAGAGTSTYTFGYDGLGRRIKTVDSATSYFLYSGSRMAYSKVGTAETIYVYLGGKLLLRAEGSFGNAVVKHYHEDISPGNVRLVTRYIGGTIIEGKYRYRPFGDMITLAGSAQRFQYAQQESDSALRLYHMGARYFDPIVGRFTQRDPIGSGYSYASNNPISAVDPSGMGTVWSNFQRWLSSNRAVLAVAALALSVLPVGGSAEAVLLPIIAGVAVGAIAVAITYVATGGQATEDQYTAAFNIGFVVGAVVGSVYGSFRLATPELAAGKAGLSKGASESRVATATGDRLVASEEPFALRAQAMADGGTREIGPQITRLSTRGLTEREAERALSDDLQLMSKFSKFFSRGADYQVAASRLGIEKSTTTYLGEWREINRLILENPEAVIRTTLGPSVVRGYIGTVEDVRLITFVYERTGLYASTTIPYPSQLLTAGLI